MHTLFERLRAWMLVLLTLGGFLFGYRIQTPRAYYSQEEIGTFTAAARDAACPGMVVAIGGGFDTEENFRPLIDRCVSHTGKTAPHMLFLPTAHYDNLEEHEEIPAWFANAGCETDVLLVTKASAEEVREKLAWADIVYETGGNLDFLVNAWQEKGVFDAVREAYARGAALIGVSSGAMCWAARGWDDFGEPVVRVIGSFPFVGEAGGFEWRDCAGLLPFGLCPHFDNTGWRMFSYEALEAELPCVGVENGAALVCEAGVYEVISDAKTPLRTVYLFWPERNIVMADVKNAPALLNAVEGELLCAR